MILEEKEMDKNITYGAVQTETEINGSDSEDIMLQEIYTNIPLDGGTSLDPLDFAYLLETTTEDSSNKDVEDLPTYYGLLKDTETVSSF